MKEVDMIELSSGLLWRGYSLDNPFNIYKDRGSWLEFEDDSLAKEFDLLLYENEIFRCDGVKYLVVLKFYKFSSLDGKIPLWMVKKVED